MDEEEPSMAAVEGLDEVALRDCEADVDAFELRAKGAWTRTGGGWGGI